MDFETSVEFEDVSVLRYAGRNLICRIDRRRVRVAPVLILPGSEVHAPGANSSSPGGWRWSRS